MTHNFRFIRSITALCVLLAPARWALCQNGTPSTMHRSFSVSVTGSGSPMILIPGLMCPAEVLQRVIDHYKPRYRIHALTLAGFGGQPAISGLRLSDIKDDLVQYIHDNKLERPVIVGHSLGGFLAFWIGTTSPDLTGRIAAVDGLPFLPALFDASATAEEAKTNAGQLRTMYASFKPDQMENMSRMSLTQMITEPKYVDVVAKWASRSDSAFVGQALYDLMTTDLRAELGKLRAPVLLIGAAKAMASNPEKLAELRAKYEKQVEKAPDHKVVLASNALHFIMFDDPEFLLQALDEFLGAR